MLQALVFDVDGTLAETEEVHRSCFNKAFRAAGLEWYWDKSLYTRLLKTTGGKERIARFMTEQGLPRISVEAVSNLHAAKNQFYAGTLASGGLQLRPGVARVVEEARKAGLKLGIATTTSRSNLAALLYCCFGSGNESIFSAIVCGEDVQRKKPDPEVYDLCLGQLGIAPYAALAIEDSAVGLKAARAAGMRTVVTPSSYTASDDFSGANKVLGDLRSFRMSEF